MSDLIKTVQQQFGEKILKTETFRGEDTVWVAKPDFLDLLNHLKDQMGFDMLSDVTAVDYLKMEKKPRFQVVYHLRNMKKNQRIRIKVPLEEKECSIPSVYHVWKSALFPERETYEMYGITFENHPELKRLLTPETFTDYPLRKDYPLRGKGEREVLLPEGS